MQKEENNQRKLLKSDILSVCFKSFSLQFRFYLGAVVSVGTGSTPPAGTYGVGSIVGLAARSLFSPSICICKSAICCSRSLTCCLSCVFSATAADMFWFSALSEPAIAPTIHKNTSHSTTITASIIKSFFSFDCFFVLIDLYIPILHSLRILRRIYLYHFHSVKSLFNELFNIKMTLAPFNVRPLGINRRVLWCEYRAAVLIRQYRCIECSDFP